LIFFVPILSKTALRMLKYSEKYLLPIEDSFDGNKNNNNINDNLLKTSFQ